VNKYCQVWLTCTDKEEASKVAEVLLQKKLVACVKQILVGSDFLWKGDVDHNDEILLLMESRDDLFEKIELEVEKLHSYETFVLTATPMTLISKKAEKWLSKSLQ
jgi:periplasmic divalent cation tolerance protein